MISDLCFSQLALASLPPPSHPKCKANVPCIPTPSPPPPKCKCKVYLRAGRLAAGQPIRIIEIGLDPTTTGRWDPILLQLLAHKEYNNLKYSPFLILNLIG